MDVEKGHKSNLEEVVAVRAMWPTPRASETFQGYETLNALKDGNQSWMGSGRGATLTTAVMARNLWPTPTASQARSEGMILQMRNLVDAGVLDRAEAEAMISGSLTPPRMEKWPTPTVCGNYNRKGASPTSGDGLATAVLKCATPTARDWQSGKASQATHNKNSRPLSEQIGGSLNPTWVEWLMGWPLGWTDLKPLATDRFRSAPQPHGDS
jgi:hypothetical protein